MKEIISIIILFFTLLQLAAQNRSDQIIPNTSATTETYYESDPKAQIKEAKLQMDYFLAQRKDEYYIFIVDGKVLSAKEFSQYKQSIYSQIKNVHFVKGIDSIMGYPSNRKRMLVLLNTQCKP